uniref:TMC domain-containing protein n=1 Tax=Plectus sambesii TaxID=2011161 RepID=A0A914W8V7_9BILA
MPSAIYTAMHLYDVVDLHLAIATSYVDDDRRTSLDNLDFFNTILGDYDERETDAFLHTESEDEENKPMTRHALLDKIRQKKEVIGKLRCQPWSMRRKRRTLRLAQKYLERHESRVSPSQRYREEIAKKWKAFCRWAANVRMYLIPWEAKIKRIESHFGSVVSSYFTFLRWILWVNLTLTFIILLFVVIPELLADAAADGARRNRTATRKIMPAKDLATADQLQTVWDFDGFLRYSPMFYGYYSSDGYVGESVRYVVPLAYFLINLFILGYSFLAILRKMAANARTSKLTSGKAEQYVFNWKVFTGWDYTIGNPETAGNAVMANVNKMRESIADYRVKMKHKFAFLRFSLRVIANVIIFGMLALSIWAITRVVENSQHVDSNSNLFASNQVPIVVSFITLVFPNCFELVGRLEKYHPRTALRLQLG